MRRAVLRLAQQCRMYAFQIYDASTSPLAFSPQFPTYILVVAFISAGKLAEVTTRL